MTAKRICIGNMAPSVLLGSVTGGAGLGATAASAAGLAGMGLTVYGNTYKQALDEGYDKDQARAYAALNTASELSLQYILGGVTALGGVVTKGIGAQAIKSIDNVMGRVALSLGKSMAGEFTEEYLQEILDPVFRNICLDENNEFKPFTEEALYAGAMGAVTAGVLEGGSTAANVAGARKLGKQVGADVLVEEALQLDPSTDAYRQAQRMREGQRKATPANLGELAQAVAQAGGDVDALRPKPDQEPEQEPAQASADMLGAMRRPSSVDRFVQAQERQAAQTEDTQAEPEASPFQRILDNQPALAQDVQPEIPERDAQALAQHGEVLNDARAARALAESYTPQEGRGVAEHILGFDTVYNAAQKGAAYEEATAGEAAQALSADARIAAWAAGTNAAQAAQTVSADVPMAAKSAAGVPSANSGGLVREYDTAKRLSGAQAVQLDALDALGQKFGIEIVARDALVNGANAAFDPDTGRILVALNAQDDAYMFVGTHELVHYVKEYADGAYAMLEDTVVEALTRAGVDVEAQLSQLGKTYGTNDRAYLAEELVANNAPVILRDKETVRRLVAKDHNLAQRVANFFRDLYNSLQATLNKMTKRGIYQSVRALEKDVAAVREIRDTLIGALEEAKAARESAASGATAKENASDMRLSTQAGEGFVQDKYYERQIDRWEELSPGTRIKVGTVKEGSALHRVGLAAAGMYFDAGKIQKSMAEHADHLTASVLLGIPEMLNDPIAITQFSNNTVSVYGDLFVGNTPVTVGVVMSKDASGNNVINKVRTVHARRDAKNQITDESILYLNENKKRTRGWFQVCGIHVPLDGAKFGFIRSITQTSTKSNVSEQESREEEPPGKMRYSLNPKFKKLYDKWDKKNPVIKFNIGATSEALKSIGIKYQNIVWDSSKIIKIKAKHPQMTDEIIKQVPNIIEDPVLIMQSQQRDSRVVLFGELFDADGAPVLAVLELAPVDRDNFILDVIKVASAYGKDTNPQQLINQSRMLYIDPDKKRTNNWLTSTGLQLPVGVANYGSIGRITYRDADVNRDDERNLKFSLKDIDERIDMDRALDALSEQDTIIQTLEDVFKLAKGGKASRETTRRIARQCVQNYQSVADVDTVAGALGEVFTFLETNANADEDARLVLGALGSIGKEILGKSVQVNRELYEASKEFREALRNTGVALTEQQRESAAQEYGSYNDYRRKVFGSVRLARDGVALDSAWSDLCDLWPGLERDTDAVDMPAALVDTLAQLRPTYDNPYGQNNDEVAVVMALDMLGAYAQRTRAKESSVLQTTLRGLTKELRDAAKARYEEQLRALKKREVQERQTLSEKYKAARASGDMVERQALLEQYRKLTDDKNAKIAAQKAKFQQRTATGKEARTARETREKIIKLSKQLMNEMIKGTNAKHVPEAFRAQTASILRSIDMTTRRGAARGADWAAQLDKLRALMQNTDVAAENLAATRFLTNVDAGVLAQMESLAGELNGRYNLEALDNSQLKRLYALLKTTRHLILTANKLFAVQGKETVDALARANIAELDKKKEKATRGKVAAMTDKFLNTGQLDSFSFFDQLGESGKRVLEALRGGFDAKIERVRDVAEFMKPVLEGAATSSWSGSKAVAKEYSVTGGKLMLTPARVMELYCLDKREQARGHLYGGGISIPDTSIAGKKGKPSRAVEVTPADVARIVATLTPEQRAVADKMQAYLTDTVAKYCNETSMEVYGYIKFAEQNYWPIVSDTAFTLTKDPAAQKTIFYLRDLGATKATVAGANNPLVLGDIFDTFTRHVDDMSSYNAFMAPLTDTMRWLNYTSKDEKGGSRQGVKASVARAYGSQAVSYIVDLVRGINGVTSSSYTTGIPAVLLRNAKVAAVGANLRVVLQQPTAYLRAATEIHPKYLALALGKKPQVGKSKQYCPIAYWKGMGYFDIRTGRGMKEIVLGQSSALDKVRNAALLPAQVADDITWGTLWNACEAEIKATRKGLTAGSEEFNRAVGKRLSYIVDRTQVVDSVFHRSQLMRSNNAFATMYTAFMAEPTKTYNTMRRALVEAVRAKENGRPQRKAVGKVVYTGVVLAATGVLTAAAAAVSDGLRDDDDSLTYWETWLKAFGENALDNVNPLGVIPGVKDVLGILQGYDVSRMELAGFEKLVGGATSLYKIIAGQSDASALKAVYNALGGLSSITGIPAYNAARTMKTLYNNIADENLVPGAASSVSEKYANLYAAMQNGDAAKIERIRAALGKDDKTIDAEIGKLLAEDTRIADAYARKTAGDFAALRAVREAVVGEGFTKEMFDKALAVYADAQAQPAQSESDGVLKVKLFTSEDLVAAVDAWAKGGSYDDVQWVMRELIADSTAADPQAAVNNKVKSTLAKGAMDAVKAGDAPLAALYKQALQTQCDYTDADIAALEKEAHKALLFDAVDAGDMAAARAQLKVLAPQGYDVDGTAVGAALQTKYKPVYLEYIAAGDAAAAKALAQRLKALGVRYRISSGADSGKAYFTEEKFAQWRAAG